MSAHGFWILFEGRELFVPFAEFPWFRQASIARLLRVEFAPPDHLHWPDLDVDLSVESIERPERFPLVSRRQAPPSGSSAPRGARTRRTRTSAGSRPAPR